MNAAIPLQSSSPQEANFRSQILTRLDDHFNKLIQSGKLQSASYLFARHGKIFATSASGRLNYQDDQMNSPMRTDTIRRIASVTKLFAATAIFQLIERGKVSLKQPVSDWIEEFKHPMFEKIQIWHLLTHTSGLWPDPGYNLEPHPLGHWDIRFAFEPESDKSFEEKGEAEVIKLKKSAWIRALMSNPPVCKPGESWNYSSSAYAILGEIVTRASQVQFEEYVMKNIVEPLGMTRTFFQVPEKLQAEVCVTNSHERSRLVSKQDRTFEPPRAGGGLYSTLEDLFRFGQMLLDNGTFNNQRILSRKSIERMSRNQFENQQLFAFNWGGNVTAMPYGMGPVVRSAVDWTSPGAYGHEGAGRCQLIIDPKLNAVVIYFVPSVNDDWLPESIIHPQAIIWSGWQ